MSNESDIRVRDRVRFTSRKFGGVASNIEGTVCQVSGPFAHIRRDDPGLPLITVELKRLIKVTVDKEQSRG